MVKTFGEGTARVDVCDKAWWTVFVVGDSFEWINLNSQDGKILFSPIVHT